MINELVDYFDLDTVHLEDNLENVLLVKRLNSFQVVETICFKANISFLSIFFFREYK